MNEHHLLLVENEQHNHEDTLCGLGEALEPKRYPIPLSLSWRIIHALLYTTGGITFLLGSLCYFPSMTDYELGGWFFTIGSIGFLIADLMEWYTNNRVGCFDSTVLRADFEEKMDIYMEPKDTLWGSYQRLENGLNFFLFGHWKFTLSCWIYLFHSRDRFHLTWYRTFHCWFLCYLHIPILEDLSSRIFLSRKTLFLQQLFVRSSCIVRRCRCWHRWFVLSHR